LSDVQFKEYPLQVIESPRFMGRRELNQRAGTCSLTMGVANSRPQIKKSNAHELHGGINYGNKL